MLQIVNTRGRAYVISASPVPAGFLRYLEDRGHAEHVARTVEGVYLETRTSLGAVLDLFERAGATVHAFRAAGTPPSWQAAARTFRGFGALTNPRSSTWLPTLPAA